MLRVLTLVCGLVGWLAAAVAAEPFERRSLDGRAKLTGQIDWPAGIAAGSKVPAVVFIAGTGLFDRRMLVGNSKTPRDFLFDDLSAAITAKGIAVVRFDYRGVACNARDSRIAGETNPQRQYDLMVQHCVDNDLRGTVTPETNLDDFAVVVGLARQHPRIDAARIGLLGVSEGVMYIGRLLARDATLAKSVALIGAPMESPKSLLQWQSTERIDTALRAMMSEPSRLTADEIRKHHETSRLQPFPLANLLPKGEAWSVAELEQLKSVREKAFSSARTLSLQNNDIEPYPGVGMTRGSYRWWNMFNRDDVRTADHFATFKGPMHIYIGEKDSQVDIARQRASLAASPLANASNVIWHAYPGKGHALGDHALLAPMTDVIREEIAADLARELSKR